MCVVSLLLLPTTKPKATATNPYVFRGREGEDRSYDDDDHKGDGNIDDDDDEDDVDQIGNTCRFFFIDDPI